MIHKNKTPEIRHLGGFALFDEKLTNNTQIKIRTVTHQQMSEAADTLLAWDFAFAAV